MSEYIQILFFLAITTLVIIIFLFFKKNTNIEKENVKLSSLIDNKDLEIENLLKQIKDNESFSDNLKNAVNTITGDIFEKRTKDFKEESAENLKNILTPLNDEIKRFKEAFKSVEGESKTSRARLSQQIEDLLKTQVETNISTDNLALALRGDYKQQGDWGETQLKVILEKCGLREGYEYELQEEFKDDNNERKRPDAIVKLPNDIVVPIDSKVSLNSYYDFINDGGTNEEIQKKVADNIKNHIKDLGSKDYANAIGSKYDRVLMFIPNEGAYYTAKQIDPLIDDFASKHNIGIVLHHTMYQTLKLINLMWSYDRQSKNAQEIANQGRLLMEKLDNSRDSFDKVGKHLDSAQTSYSDALKQLFTGRGSLQDKAKKLENLGVNSNKK
tara:strand:- start:284 stop:1441 length:1158 start_codon:yes stop_codon:yes gene_type:complete